MKLSLLKNVVAFTLFMVLSIQATQGQALGTWQAYMSYQNATMVAVDSNGYVYAVYKGYPQWIYDAVNNAALFDGSLLRYDPVSEEVKKISKTNGLNDVYISCIAYVESEQILAIVYDNGNIDLYDTNSSDSEPIVYNLAGLKNESNIPDKTVNGIDVYGDYIFLSLNSGIMAIDVKNKVIKDTYKINKKTYSMCFWKENDSGTEVEYVYAATEEGVMRASKKSNLSSESSWDLYPLDYGGNEKLITKILTFDNNFIFYQSGVGIYYLTPTNSIPTKLSSAPATVNQLTVLNNNLVLINGTNMYLYSSLTSVPTTSAASGAVNVSSQHNSSTYWFARGNTGISKHDDLTHPIVVNSPKRNLAFNLTFDRGKLLVVGGAMWENNINLQGTLMVMESDKWYNIDEAEVQTQMRVQVGTSTGVTCRDFSAVVIDPRDVNHYFVAGYGEGLYEFMHNPDTKKIEFQWLHAHVNTGGILGSVLTNGNNIHRYVRLAGLAYDSDNNLYVMACAVDNPMAIYTKNDTWMNYFDSQLSGRELLSITITRNNQKWIYSAREIGNTGGLYVLNDADNISYFSRDFTDQDDKKLEINFFSCITEDLNGTIWVGTDIGPIVFYNPLSITALGTTSFDRCSRMKMPRNDGMDLADYLLEGVYVSTIAVDSDNRKWIGTKGAGVFLVSPSGDEVIANYTADNSPLLSDNITKIVINDENGEVFIGTDKGLISYMNLATGGELDYSNVYAYPNPVRPDFTGEVVVTGLVRDSNVKITDITGNIVYQGTSLGGQFAWNCKTKSGERVKTGVYLVFAATPDGAQGVVTKIVVIK